MRNRNRQLVLARHPVGVPAPDDWKLVEAPVPEPGEGEILVRTIYLSVDPYMRGRISGAKNYAAGVEINDLMQGGGVGQVVQSRHPGFTPGDFVESFDFGWQDYPVLKGEAARKLDPDLAQIRTALGVLGLPGLTAYFALLDIGQPKPGDTVVVSAAAGAVGQLVGQIAKLKGCRPVAVAGSDEKIALCRQDYGYVAGINHRTADLPAALATACPDGIDVYFDNTAGPILDAVMGHLALHARIVVCGTIAIANRLEEPDIGPRFQRQILVARARMEGFLLFDFQDRYEEGLRQLAAWLNDGQLVFREDIMVGLENTPQAFIRLLTGENRGKQLVSVSDDPTV